MLREPRGQQGQKCALELQQVSETGEWGMGVEMQFSEAVKNKLTGVNINKGGCQVPQVSNLSLVDQVSH